MGEWVGKTFHGLLVELSTAYNTLTPEWTEGEGILDFQRTDAFKRTDTPWGV